MSDFDLRHQINVNGIFDLPFSRNRRYGTNVPGFVNQFIGDWSIAGLTRWTSGIPYKVQNCRSCWPTNWNLQGNASLVTPGQLPDTETTKNVVDHRPSPFPDPAAALKFYRFSLPGETGVRNILRGDGYFTIDLSLSKAWHLFADNRVRFRWDVFNLTNTARFDVNRSSMTPELRHDGVAGAWQVGRGDDARRCRQLSPGLRCDRHARARPGADHALRRLCADRLLRSGAARDRSGACRWMARRGRERRRGDGNCFAR